MKLVNVQKIFLMIIFIGFLVGILYTNLFASEYMEMTGVFNSYYLQSFLETEFVVSKYLPYILRIRVLPIVILIIVAYSKLSKIGVFLFLLWTGFLYGIYMSLGAIQLGIGGILFCLLGLFPQMIFYIPAYIIVIVFTYNYPESSWNPLKIGVVILCVLSGVVLECQFNSQILSWLITVI